MNTAGSALPGNAVDALSSVMPLVLAGLCILLAVAALVTLGVEVLPLTQRQHGDEANGS